MAEPRRIQLTTLSGNVPLPSPASKPTSTKPVALTAAAGACCEVGATDSQPPKPTVRYVLALFESDERRCPEFWYSELSNQQVELKITKFKFQRASNCAVDSECPVAS